MCFKLSLFSSLVLSVSASLASAASSITVCDLPTLTASIENGGDIVFGCDGEFNLDHTFHITKDTSLDAQGHKVVIRGRGAVQLFLVDNQSHFSARGIVFADGAVVQPAQPTSETPEDGLNAGGAAFQVVDATLILNDCTLTNHLVRGGTGGIGTVFDIPMPPAKNGGAGLGGAICSLGGRVSITNSLIAANRAEGGLRGQGPNQTFGATGPASGGGIYASNTLLHLDHATLTANQAYTPSSAGGFLPLRLPGSTTSGGALSIAAGSSVMVGCHISDNSVDSSAEALGGAIYWASGSSNHWVELSVLERNAANGGKGFRHDTAYPGLGGAIYAAGSGWIHNTRLSGNIAAGGRSLAPGIAGGGAIYSTSTLRVTASTLNENQALGGDGTSEAEGANGASGSGGGILSRGTLFLTNSTLVLNRAVSGANTTALGTAGRFSGRGGALVVESGTATVSQATFSQNSVGSQNTPFPAVVEPLLGAAIYTESQVILGASVLNDPLEGSEFVTAASGQLSDAGYNFTADPSVTWINATSRKGSDAKLGALADNGGPTPTQLPLLGSPLRDVIPSELLPTTDQRGFARPSGAYGDIGATEASSAPSLPQIQVPPSNLTVRWGHSALFSVSAAGSAPLSYSWSKNQSLISGASNPSLTLNQVDVADQGTYTVTVSNSLGSVSASATLTVDATPHIDSSPASAVIKPASSLTLQVQASGPALHYQWRRNTDPIPGKTGATLEIQNAGPLNKGSYAVVVSNDYGTVTSEVAEISFDPTALSILIQPESTKVLQGCTATFHTLASGIPTIRYQWTKDGTEISGATSDTFSLAAVRPEDAGSYQVVLDNGYRVVKSEPVTLEIQAPGVENALKLSVGRAGDTLLLTFSGEKSRTYHLERSTTMKAWETIASFSPLSNGPLQQVEALAPAGAVYYRVVADCP